MTTLEEAPDDTEQRDRSVGRFVYEYAALISFVSFISISIVTILLPQPRNVGELIVWLGAGVGLLSLGAGAARYAGHHRVYWPGEGITVWPPSGDDDWSRRERERWQREQAIKNAKRAAFDYLGKLLAIDAALVALVATLFHLISQAIG